MEVGCHIYDGRTAEANLSGVPAHDCNAGATERDTQGHPGPIADSRPSTTTGVYIQENHASVKVMLAAINQELRLKPNMEKAS